MGMRAAETTRPMVCRLNCRRKQWRDFALLSRTGPEAGQRRFTISRLKESIHTTKQNGVLQRRSSAGFPLSWFMPRDHQLAGSAAAEQLNSHNDRSNHQSMNAVDSHRVDRMEIRQRLTLRPAEGNVSAHLSHRAGGSSLLQPRAAGLHELFATPSLDKRIIGMYGAN